MSDFCQFLTIFLMELINIGPAYISFGTISPVVDLHGQQKHSGKADHSTLTSGGSEHA